MTTIKQNFIVAGLVIAIVLVVITKYARLNSTESFNQIDDMSIELGHLNTTISPNSLIGFRTNLQGFDGASLYYKSCFVLAPAVVIDANQDTTLIIEHPDFPPINQPGRQIIKAGHIGQLSYRLVK